MIRAVTQDATLLPVELGNISLVVDVDAVWSADALTTAVQRWIRVFPILGCHLRCGFWRDQWEPFTVPLSTFVHVATSAQLEADTLTAISEPVDVTAGAPFRLSALTSDNGQRTRLVLSTSHVLSDGNGALLMLSELCSQLAGGGRSEPVVMNRSFLQLLSAAGPAKWPMLLWEMVKDTGSFMDALKASSWTKRFTPVPDTGRACVKRLHFSKETSIAFRRACKAAGATINDGLVAEALRVGSCFSDGAKIASAYTVNLRQFLPEERVTISNLSGFMMVVADRDIAADPERNLAFVHARIAQHKKGIPGLGSNLFPIVNFGWMPRSFARAATRTFRKRGSARSR